MTAYSACNCTGVTTAEVLAALDRGEPAFRPPPFDVDVNTVCGVVSEDLPPVPPRLRDFDCRQARIALQVFDQIERRVSRARSRWGRDRVGLVLATSTGGIDHSEEAFLDKRLDRSESAARDFRRRHAFYAFAELLRELAGIGGPTYVVSTACSSSGKALASARRLVLADLVDAVLVGGVDSLARTTVCGFGGLEVLSPEPCRPFAAGRDGMNVGEGGALLLIERTGDGRALLLGAGESSDAYHMCSPHPEGVGARSSMLAALADAGVEAAEIDLINAHGTATPLGDAAEARAIFDVFGGDTPVVSTKGLTGHMLGAAGATEALFCVSAIESGSLPASVGSRPVDPELAIRVNTAPARSAPRVVMSNSFGFGGNNVSLVMGRA